ncbi:sulfotransferase family 2 domain-containing protein [Nocardioides sp.]|uniref:sulfotransferase family 2 domain-containing protein n=1 Tax=Nocardioides sp. TaxID=35761 RepID=UPI00378503AF
MDEPAADDGMLDALRQVPGAVSRTYLAPGVKVMFESINKNACTSLKWMMADLAGEDLDTFQAGWQPFTSHTDAVHNRNLWKASPRLDRLSPEARAEIGPDHGWFVFAVVRDPRVRVFSAWQNRLLMQIPIAQQYREEWWYPRHPVTRESVLEDFAKFVDLLDQHPEHKVRAKDPHFRDQVELLAEHAIPYTRIYDISEMGQLRADLAAHLAAQGHARELHIPKANPTPLRAIGAAFEGGVREKIERVYAADFERFGDRWDFAKVENAAPWRDADLDACESESELSLRIYELHELARSQREAAEQARARVAELEAELRARDTHAADADAGGLIARVRRRGSRRAR